VQSGNAPGLELTACSRSAERWFAATRHVIDQPDGVLCGLNFETLIAAAPEPLYWIVEASSKQAGAMVALSTNGRASSATREAAAAHADVVANPRTVYG